MRLTVTDLPRAFREIGWREALSGWWFELPWRHNPIRKLRRLLFTPGLGWLRWGWGTYSYTEVIDYWIGGPTYEAPCAPPLRRVWLWTRSPIEWVLRGGGWHRWEDEWFRIPWGNYHMSWSKLHDSLRDPEWPEGYL